MSRLEVAADMNTAQQNIWAIEMGKQNITLEYQDELLAVLKITPIELMHLVPAYIEHLEKCLRPEDIDMTDKN